MFVSPSNNDLHSYTLKLYFPDTEKDQNDDMGKTFKAYVNIREGHYKYPGYNEDKGVNHPVLFTGMTPIKWDENNDEIETTEDDLDWYDYDNKRWANAKSADGSYWVWIPRYAYKITSGYHSSETGTIDVKFLKGTSKISSDNLIVETSGYVAHEFDTSMHYFLHPSFKFNDDEPGFWMAKFEPSAHEELASGIDPGSCDEEDNVSTKSIKIVPDAVSWRCINIKNAYLTSLAMKDNPIYGWDLTEVDTHMMTNIEWGAVAYLSESQYGADGEIWNNSYTGFQTGCSGPTVSADRYDNCISYKTADGQKASTTHNIYGVYDMSGGAMERVMGNYNGVVGSDGFTKEDLLAIDSKYITKYFTSPEKLNNGYGVDYDLNIYGDAVYETSYDGRRYNGSSWNIGGGSRSWYSDYSYLPHISASWMPRGGHHGYKEWAGVFSFTYSSGNPFWADSFRPVLVPLS